MLGISLRHPRAKRNLSALEERMPAVSRVTSLSEWLLRQSFVWGGMAALAFYAAIFRLAGVESFWHRWFAGHEMAYFATTLFFVGLAALVIKLLQVGVQMATVESVRLATDPLGVETVNDVPNLLKDLQESTSGMADNYLVRRLREALEFIQRKGSADNIEKQLRHLEETDLSRMHNGYGLPRLTISVIPIFGFLGTVIGITLAIDKLDLSGEDVSQSLPEVVAGLSVAFYTTAQALGLSILLLVVKFCVERVELRLLSTVNESASRQLVGRFQQIGTETDPNIASMKLMSARLLEVVESGFTKQFALVNANLEQTGEFQAKVLENASEKSAEILSNTASNLDEAISGAVLNGLTRHAETLNEGVRSLASDLEGTLVRHAELLNEGLDQHTGALTEAERALAEENRRHLADVEAAVGEAMLVATTRQEKLIRQSEDLLKEMQVALVEAAGTTVAQQEQLIKQGDILLRVVEAIGQVKNLEEALNSNLNALAGSHNFEKTVTGLAAALQLLSARMGDPMAIHEIDLTDEKSQNQAA